jgi:hypothetical protein
MELVSDPAAPGREFVLHATDEVMTEFALVPYAAAAPLHVAGVVTRDAKYATYSDWRPGSLEPRAGSEQAELYDYSTREGVLEIENLAGRSAAEARLRATLERAVREELDAPLPVGLRLAQRDGLAEYQHLAERERSIPAAMRLRQLRRLMRDQPREWA